MNAYLAVYEATVSSILVRDEEKVHKLVYYINRALHKAEFKYPLIEKLAFALVTVARKLRPYFQAHNVDGSVEGFDQPTLANGSTKAQHLRTQVK